MPYRGLVPLQLYGCLLAAVLITSHPVVAATDDREPTAVAVPSGTVTLSAALATAVANHPRLHALTWEKRARAGETQQAGLYPNPTVGTEIENFNGTGDRRTWRAAETTVTIGQLFLLGGKRAKAQTAAAAAEDLAGWSYESARLNVLADTAKAFVGVLALQERLTIATQLEQLATQARHTVAATVQAGAVSPIEASRAEVVLSQAGIARRVLLHELSAARATLAASWGATDVTFERVQGQLDDLRPPPPLKQLLAATDGNPDVARWDAERSALASHVALEEARAVPDITVRVGARHFADGNDGAAVAEVSIPLPFFDRNQGAIATARARLAQVDAERAATVTSVRSLIIAAYQDTSAAFERARSLRQTTIPEAERLHAGALDAYSKGLMRYIEVLDAQRTLFDLRGQYIQALADHHRAAAEIARLTGGSLADGAAGGRS